jgi:glycerol-3-phosphate dehydrogenase
MWTSDARAALPALARQDWDLLVIGGGITGAGVLLEAARAGYRALLVEQRDFAWGTSSRSSKLIHGGLRYLSQGKLGLTRESVREREALLRGAPGLVEEQSFALGDYIGRKPGRWKAAIGLAIYDRLAGQHGQGYLPAHDFLMLAPHIRREGLRGGLCYHDAKTDDARLVLRVLQEAQAWGGTALNYVAAERVAGAGPDGMGSAELVDRAGGGRHRIRARAVVNATGAWADALRRPADVAPARRLRPLRGSHLVFDAWRLPVAQAVSLMHPRDGRPVFAYPWEGATLVGTTDLDHAEDLAREAAITPGEVDYLMEGLAFQFPELGLTRADIVSTYAGVRPVLDGGHADPSREPRDHAVWLEDGVLTVTGGKLTTFRTIAHDALRAVAGLLPPRAAARRDEAIFAPAPALPAGALSASLRQRLAGRYGAHAAALVACASPGELDTIGATGTIWAQLRWAARAEAVLHLDDLLLRRTRLGLLLREGGAAILPRVRAICADELGWDDARWAREEVDYRVLWRSHYGVPRALP